MAYLSCGDTKMTFRNWLLFLAMVLIWGSNWSVMKLGLGISPPFAFVSTRLLFSAASLASITVFTRPQIPRDRDSIVRLLSYSLISTASFAATNLGLVSYSSGTGAVLTYTQPLMVFALALMLLKERVSALKLVGILMGFSGVAVLFLEDTSGLTSWPALLMLLGAFFWALGTVYYKLRLGGVDAALVNLVQATITFLLLSAFSAVLEPVKAPWTPEYIAILAYAGIGASAIGMTIWLFLLKGEGATSLSGSVLVVPVIALLCGWFFMGEFLDLRSVIGSGLVLAGVYLVNRRNIRDKASVMNGQVDGSVSNTILP